MKPIDLALAVLESRGVVNYSATAREFGCDRTTLSRRHRGITDNKERPRENIRIHTNHQEDLLFQRIERLSELSIPFTAALLRNLVYEISKIRPGKNWVARFTKRYKYRIASLSIRGLNIMSRI